jgi:hypothetical protein
MPEVPRTSTPLTVETAASELLAALRRAGIDPNGDQARLLLAQLWLETARGSACNNHNPGNLTAGNTADFFRPQWYELTPDSSPRMVTLHAAMLAGQAPSAFAAYATFEQGFDDYVRQIKTKFPTILEAARTGDAEAMGAAIRTSGYAPDAGGTTGQNLASLAREFKTRKVFDDLPLAPAVAPPVVEASPASSFC